MGYDIYSFFSLFNDLPKFPKGSNGEEIRFFYEKQEETRLPIEAFIGMKLESLITKVSLTQKDHIRLYRIYKSRTQLIQNYYNSLNNSEREFNYSETCKRNSALLLPNLL